VFDYDYTNLLSLYLGRNTFFPSVANTGPQAVYVREILYRFWEMAGRDSAKIPKELLTMVISFDEDGNPVCSVDLAKYGLSMPFITPKPDPNILFYPQLEYFGSNYHVPYGIPYTVIFPHEQEEGWTPPPPPTPKAVEVPPPDPAPETKQPNKEKPSAPPEKSPTNKTFLWLAIFALAVFGGIVAWRKAKRK